MAILNTAEPAATPDRADANLVPGWALARPKPLWQSFYDFALAPARMIVLPDEASERLHLTSLRAERFATVLPHLRGRVLDIGAGDNMLLRLYRGRAAGDPAAGGSLGLDVVDRGGGCALVEDAAALPFPDGSFDTVSFVACLNHIPQRHRALREARRVLRPGGRLVVTMIGRSLGRIGHALWWYSEDKHKHRDVDPREEPGLEAREILGLLTQAGFLLRSRFHFCYGLNNLYLAEKPPSQASCNGVGE
jgi:SAM-dependent methyltransferase